MDKQLRGLNALAQGQTIREIRQLTPWELDAMYWPEPNKYAPALLIELSSGTRLVITQDVEGNGPGALVHLQGG